MSTAVSPVDPAPSTSSPAATLRPTRALASPRAGAHCGAAVSVDNRAGAVAAGRVVATAVFDWVTAPSSPGLSIRTLTLRFAGSILHRDGRRRRSRSARRTASLSAISDTRRSIAGGIARLHRRSGLRGHPGHRRDDVVDDRADVDGIAGLNIAGDGSGRRRHVAVGPRRRCECCALSATTRAAAVPSSPARAVSSPALHQLHICGFLPVSYSRISAIYSSAVLLSMSIAMATLDCGKLTVTGSRNRSVTGNHVGETVENCRAELD